MFSKATKAADAQGSQTRKPTVASLIAPGVTIRGDIKAAGDLHLDGAVNGDVDVERLTIGPTGSVVGAIRADSVEIRGQVSGAVTARQVRLSATARVDGDISHAELAIEAGAHFEGRSLTLPEAQATEPVALLSAAAE
ncbi:polymer-forming cytoskeletal protein [Phenylobacterium sp.]